MSTRANSQSTRAHGEGSVNSARNKLALEIRRIVAEILEVQPDSIGTSAHLIEDLGMDSMMALEILATVEKRFRIRVPEENLPKMTTIDRIVEITGMYVAT